MYTEEFILTDRKFSIKCVELSQEDLKTVKHYIETTRHLQEIHHLFLIFKKNISTLQSEFILKNGGNAFRGQKSASSKADNISINAHIINIISAGRTLVESMECYIKTNSNITTESKTKYLDFYHKIYDSCFAYRLLIRLRDYSQHGHLPVSSRGNNYFFDLMKILNKPHYKHNNTFENQTKNIIDDITTKFHDTPTIALTETLAEYVVNLFSIYKMFWYQTDTELAKTYDKFQLIVSNYPDNIISKPNNLSGLFVYDVVNRNMHIVNPKDNPNEMVISFKKEAMDAFDEYSEAFRNILGGNLYINCIDEQIVIESGEIFADKSIKNCEIC